jgi:tetratricopeptide (TPR) repeat protein
MTFSSSVGEAFAATKLGQAYVLGIMIYFSGAGFLLGYLWTRLSFGLAIKEADKDLVERRIEKFEADIRADHQALLLTTRQLSPARGETEVAQDDLNEAVAQATKHTKVKIFYDAVTARQDPERAQQAIPVFQALIKSDTADMYHQNHANLGYALKDKPKADYAAAEEALTKAIEIRDRLAEGGYGAYEFNRAVCRVHLGRPKEEIVKDFKRAAEDMWVREWSLDDRALVEWLTKNQVNREGLGFS